MDIVQLRWFQQAADGTTVTEISDLEGVSQSGVSRSLARLEREVGVALLRRSGRVLRMTRAGVAFKHHVDKALADLDDGFAVLSQLSSPESGTVALAFQPSLGPWLVPGLVAGFRRAHPLVRFELQQVRDQVSGHVIADGSADLEITAVAPSMAGVRWQALAIEPLRLAVPTSDAHPAADPVDLAEYAAAPFIVLRKEFVLRGVCESLCERSGFQPRIAFEGDDVSTMIGFVGAGLGVAIVPPPRRETADGGGTTAPRAGSTTGTTSGAVAVRYLEIADDLASRKIGISWSSGRRLPPVVEAFRAHVIEALGRMTL